MKLAAVMIHGIGGSAENWAQEPIRRLNEKILAQLKAILKDKAPAEISDVLVVKSVYWKTALQKPQNELQAVLARYFGWVLQGLNFWENLFKSIFKLFYKYQNMIVTLFIGDIVGYMAKEGKLGIEIKIDAAMEALAAEAPEKEIPLTFISHSLGTVIASNYIYDKMDDHRKNGVNRMDERFIFSNMFTAGSPIALFSMKFNGPESFNRPIEVENPNGRWVNFLDKDDPIAMPLRLLNSSYKKAVSSDYQVNTGWFWSKAHTEYFTKSNTLDLIARKLAIDWVALNLKLSREKIDKLYKEYDRDIVTSFP
jgi:hypothetical protein